MTWPVAPLLPITFAARSLAWQGGVPGGRGAGPSEGAEGPRLGASGVHGTTCPAGGAGGDESADAGARSFWHPASRTSRTSPISVPAINKEYGAAPRRVTTWNT